MFKMLSDFFEKRREKELLARAAIAERDAAQVKRAQEMVNELSKIAGIEPPTVVSINNRRSYFHNKDNNIIGVPIEHANRVDDKQLFAILAHEVGHAQNYDERLENYEKEKGERKRAAQAVLLSMGGIFGIGAIAAVATGNGFNVGAAFQNGGASVTLAASILAAIAGNNAAAIDCGKAHMDEESRADRFAAEKAGADIHAMWKNIDEMRKYGNKDPEKAHLIPGVIMELFARNPSPYLRDAYLKKTFFADADLAGLPDESRSIAQPENKLGAPSQQGGQPVSNEPPARIPSRFSRPPVLQEPEVTSTGRLVKPNARGPDRDYDAPEPAPEKRRGLVLQMKRDR